tara:strand:+ start:423 stop:788 length:366 start_codon:yes stop_codon:yes gene_type:complete
MADAIVAIDMSDTERLMEPEALNKWFESRSFEVNDDNIVRENETLGFSHYAKAGVVIYRFDNTDDYFPNIVEEFIEDLNDGDNTTISVAEDGPMGFDTIVEMNISDFIKYVINGSDTDGDE